VRSRRDWLGAGDARYRRCRNLLSPVPGSEPTIQRPAGFPTAAGIEIPATESPRHTCATSNLDGDQPGVNGDERNDDSLQSPNR
jgi:hypothetical protein